MLSTRPGTASVRPLLTQRTSRTALIASIPKLDLSSSCVDLSLTTSFSQLDLTASCLDLSAVFPLPDLNVTCPLPTLKAPCLIQPPSLRAASTSTAATSTTTPMCQTPRPPSVTRTRSAHMFTPRGPSTSTTSPLLSWRVAPRKLVTNNLVTTTRSTSAAQLPTRVEDGSSRKATTPTPVVRGPNNVSRAISVLPRITEGQEQAGELQQACVVPLKNRFLAGTLFTPRSTTSTGASSSSPVEGPAAIQQTTRSKDHHHAINHPAKPSYSTPYQQNKTKPSGYSSAADADAPATTKGATPATSVKRHYGGTSSSVTTTIFADREKTTNMPTARGEQMIPANRPTAWFGGSHPPQITTMIRPGVVTGMNMNKDLTTTTIRSSDPKVHAAYAMTSTSTLAGGSGGGSGTGGASATKTSSLLGAAVPTTNSSSKSGPVDTTGPPGGTSTSTTATYKPPTRGVATAEKSGVATSVQKTTTTTTKITTTTISAGGRAASKDHVEKMSGTQGSTAQERTKGVVSEIAALSSSSSAMPAAGAGNQKGNQHQKAASAATGHATTKKPGANPPSSSTAAATISKFEIFPRSPTIGLGGGGLGGGHLVLGNSSSSSSSMYADAGAAAPGASSSRPGSKLRGGAGGGGSCTTTTAVGAVTSGITTTASRGATATVTTHTTRSSSAASSSDGSGSTNNGATNKHKIPGPLMTAPSFPASSTSPGKYRAFSSEEAGRQAAEAYYGKRGAGGGIKGGQHKLYAAGGSYTQETIRIKEEFNPAKTSLQESAKRWLQLPEQARICKLEGFQGGLNKGVYVAEGAQMESKVIKVVKAGSPHPGLLSEAENCHKQKQELPGLLLDEAVTFPSHIIRVEHVLPESGEREALDVFLMRKARGQRLAETLASMWRSNKHRVFDLLNQLGRFLKAFHLRYPQKEHGDVQPSNIFYEESSGLITLIDVGGMGQKTVKSDRQHFAESLKLIADTYGSEMISKGVKAFEQGYDSQWSRTYDPRVV